MIRIDITKEQIIRAEKKYPFDKLNGSITNGEGNIFGAIGEVIVADHFMDKGLEVDTDNTYDYDIILDEYKVDVKTKKFTAKYTPTRQWTINVSHFNTTQKCDFYFFVGVSDDLKNGYLYGHITPEVFYSESVFNTKGEIDPNGNGEWTFAADCYNIPISKLNSFK